MASHRLPGRSSEDLVRATALSHVALCPGLIGDRRPESRAQLGVKDLERPMLLLLLEELAHRVDRRGSEGRYEHPATVSLIERPLDLPVLDQEAHQLVV